ncbi:MAG TPA: hypothetical protein PKM20_07725 [Nitrosomonas sp.]|uniref:hypothetical protein n=1 Tax=Nitrosomonas sp. TaxID=42353 RepID=UPI00208745E7|nr:hypothetical protein [Nitrosomonas sp.]GJL74762.1 MAG: hypothetical protein NMNS02_08680 [Nitrosomonas sp.]HNP26614.1 hypothetical protein [Nitrosomonas sp.]
MQPTVVMNHHRQTAIIVAKSGKKLQIIKLGKGRLTVTSLSAAEIETQGYKVSQYSPNQAARSYLEHGAGVSKRARKYLEEISRHKFSDTLTLT